MASLGDRVTYKVGEAIVVEFEIRVAGELQTGLSPVVTIHDEADGSFSTPTVTEPLTGLYRASFTPDAAGVWHALVEESTIPWETRRSYEVRATVAGDTIGDIDTNTDTLLTDVGDVQAAIDTLSQALVLKSFTAAASSTASNVRTGVTDEATGHYNSAVVVVVDDSDGGKAAARRVRVFNSTNGQFVLETDLPFTPEAGVDQVYVLAANLGRVSELVGAGASGNPFIGSWVDRIINKDGSQTFSQGTDSLEAIRDQGDSAWITATGFAVPGDQMNLVDGAITAVKFAANAITSAVLATNCITSDEIDSTAVTEINAAVLAAIAALNNITATDVDTLLTANHGAGSWQTATGFAVPGDQMNLVDGAITAAKFAAAAITAAVIATDAIGSDELAATAVTEINAAVLSAIAALNDISAADVDTQLSGTHGAGSWETATGFATSAAVAAVQASIDALNNLSSGDVAAAIAADPGVLKILHRVGNRVDLNPANGVVTVYNDAGAAEFTGLAYLDAAQTTLYDGTGPVHSVSRLVAV